MVSLCGDSIVQADVNLKLPRAGKDLYQNCSIREDAPWNLQQIQDAGNHLQLALEELNTLDKGYEFKYEEASSHVSALIFNLLFLTFFRNATEVDQLLTRIMGSLSRSRSAIVNPKKRSLDELHSCRQVVSNYVSFSIRNLRLPLIWTLISGD